MDSRMTQKRKTVLTAEPGKQEMWITREFDAPPELVFKAFVDPELYPQWLGPRGLTTTLETFEPYSGGSWSFIQKDDQGQEYRFHGIYHLVQEPELIIDTFEYEGLPEPGHVLLETARFEPLPGNRTRLIAHSVFLSVEDRDGMLQDDMEQGMNESYERLDELLAQLKK